MGLFAAALLMKLLVPAGYMASASNGMIVVEICSASGPKTTVMAIPGLEHRQDGGGDHGKAEMPCAFSALSAPALAGADPLLLVLAIAFVMAAAFRLAAPRAVAAPAFLRPPPRGPPAVF